MRLIAAMFVCLALAGCTDSAPVDDSAPTGQEDGVFGREAVSLAQPGYIASDTINGQFEFQENQYFVGHMYGMLGQDPGFVQQHDISALIPASGLYQVTMTVSSDPDNGDIDAWFDGEPIILTSCECPFGGNIEVIGYGFGSGDVSISIQYDEISSSETDFGYAIDGFDYQIDVTVEAFSSGVPPGVPVAVTLNQEGQAVEIANLTNLVTVYDPNDNRVAVLEPGQTTFTFDGTSTAGEYVFIQQSNGAPVDVQVSGPEIPNYRVLNTRQDFQSTTYQPGTGGSMTFDAELGMIQFFACAISPELTISYQFEVKTPADEVMASAGGVGDLGYGTCVGTNFGGPDQQVGTWSVSLTQAAGSAVELFAWAYYYVR